MRCAAPAYLGCLTEVHGNLEQLGDEVIGTTGGEKPEIVRLTLAGAVVRRWDTRLTGNHLTEFALAGRSLYAVGSCGYTGGFSAVDLRTNVVRVRVRPGSPPPRVCGERAVQAPAGRLLVAKTQRPVPRARRRGALLVVAASTGRVVRTVRLPAEPVDVRLAPR